MAKADNKSVWETLSAVNVNDHKEDKNGLSYLSWAWAWGEVKNNYPDATYEVHDNIIYPDSTVEVRVSVTVADQTHLMWLPVMDYRNKAISGPTSRDISDARMRCFAKAIAMHGLGHYIYAGEDIPQSASEARQEEATKKPAPAKQKAKDASPAPSKEDYHATPDVVTVEGDEDKHKTGDWEMVTQAFIKFLPIHKTEETVRQFWSANKDALQQLKGARPDDYDEVVEAFKKRNAELKGEAA